MVRHAIAALALSCTVMAPSAVWYFFPHLPSICISTISEVFTGVKAWLTPPLLFLLMNVVVLALAFSSGFIKQRPLNKIDGEGRDDLRKIRRCKTTEDNADGEDQEEEEEEEEGEDPFYPEVLSTFFGDGGHVAHRKPRAKHSVSAARKGHSFLVANPSSEPACVTPKTRTANLKPVSAPISGQSAGGDRDVDERADAFIGGFYKKMELEQVDLFRERLERSYGR